MGNSNAFICREKLYKIKSFAFQKYTPNNSMTSLKIYGLFAVLHKKAQLFDLWRVRSINGFWTIGLPNFYFFAGRVTRLLDCVNLRGQCRTTVLHSCPLTPLNPLLTIYIDPHWCNNNSNLQIKIPTDFFFFWKRG